MHESRAGPLSWTILLKLIYLKKKCRQYPKNYCVKKKISILIRLKEFFTMYQSQVCALKYSEKFIGTTNGLLFLQTIESLLFSVNNQSKGCGRIFS